MRQLLRLWYNDYEDSPFDWWKRESCRLTMLSQVQVARKYLCVNATSVASERIFSLGGNIVTKKRSCMKPHTVNELVFLGKNL